MLVLIRQQNIKLKHKTKYVHKTNYVSSDSSARNIKLSMLVLIRQQET